MIVLPIIYRLSMWEEIRVGLTANRETFGNEAALRMAVDESSSSQFGHYLR